MPPKRIMTALMTVAVAVGSMSCAYGEDKANLYKEWDSELKEYTRELCEEKGVNESIVLGIIWNESRFQSDAMGHNTDGTTDYGLMQLNTVTLPFLRENVGINSMEETLDAKTNIECGVSLLEYYNSFSGGDYESLKMYQTGVGAYNKGVVHPAYTRVVEASEEYQEVVDTRTNKETVDKVTVMKVINREIENNKE